MPKIAGQLRPQTTRQQAFGQAIDQLGGSFGQLVGDMQTERQKAFNQAMRMREQGYDVSPEQVQEASNIFTGGEGAMQKLFENRTQEYKDALEARRAEKEAAETERSNKLKRDQEQRDWERKFKEDQAKWQREKFDLETKRKQEDKLAKMTGAEQKQDAQERELGIKISGGETIMARTKDEAKKLRDAVTEGKKAFDTIDQIKKLGKDVAVWDVGRTSKINGLKNILAGQLRTAILGPGIMDKSEFKRLIDTMGDPTRLTSTEAIEFGKLDQLKGILQDGLEGALESKAVGYRKGSLFQDKPQTMLSGSEMDIPYAPTGQPELMPEAMAGQEIPAEAIVKPERTQFRQSRIQELRAKAQGR